MKLGFEFFEPAAEVGFGGGEVGGLRFGDVDVGGEVVVEGLGEGEDELGGVEGAEGLDVEIDDVGSGGEASREVAEDGGFAHAAVAEDDDGFDLAGAQPKFFELAKQVFAPNEEVASDGWANDVGVLNGFEKEVGVAKFTSNWNSAQHKANSVKWSFRNPNTIFAN